MIAIAGLVLSNPWMRMVALSGILFVVGFWKGFAFEHSQITELKVQHKIEIARAVSERDSYWQQTLAKSDQEHEAEMRKAIESANAVPAISGGKPQLIKLCGNPATNADCNEAGSDRLRGIQKD